jgi:hypothetical protein
MTMELFFFGDQTLDIQPYFKDLISHRNSPVLDDFLAKSYHVLRTELDQLPRNVKAELPRFTCIDDIILRKKGDKSCIALELALTTMYQLGVFMRYVENNQADACLVLEPMLRDRLQSSCRTLGEQRRLRARCLYRSIGCSCG